ncbi:MAG: DNA repair protein RecN [Rickettsiales bacterium]|jgi:DNA repair protein RecN (Recombination protein N)|nr:DNA repair protein RecN [Rickettsiales bacterium]
MLNRLFISNVILIDRLELTFGGGLNVLTGETGAGKSILLDALALALGARSDTGLLRRGADTANVIAEFNDAPALHNLLNENGIEIGESLTLRRTLAADGKSRAWINDTPVSIKLLKEIGDSVCEIHGQFENHTLLNPETHITALDTFGKYDLSAIRDAYTKLHSAEKKLKELVELSERSASEREFLEHNVRELSALNPQVGEEEELATRRAILMDAEKNAAILNDAMIAVRGLDGKIFDVARILQRIKTDPNPYETQINSLYEIAEIAADVENKITPTDTDIESLENIESRLFAIRAASRKHRVSADELPEALERMRDQLNTIDNFDAELKKIKSVVAVARTEFDRVASDLTKKRAAAATALRDEILRELPDLKLGGADFTAEISAVAPSIMGADAITFLIKTNPGSNFAPINRVASGGELARFMLALRVVLRGADAQKTMIFDEVDTGISGATASAVGARLGRLAGGGQIIVITHSAQVAGFANKHFLISKESTDITTKTNVCEITGDARLNEIARIISGDKITDEAIATAKTLIKSL